MTKIDLHPVGTELFTLHTDPFEVCRGCVISHTEDHPPQYVCDVFSSTKGRYQETVPSIFLTADDIMQSIQQITRKFKENYPLTIFHRKERAIGSILVH